MITALDTNVLLDVFLADPTFGPRSREAIRTCTNDGPVVACPEVWGEVVAAFTTAQLGRTAMETLGVGFAPVSVDAAVMAGAQFAEYHRNGGTRARIIADFIIGAHAALQADRLLTRDRGFFRTYFGRLAVVDPSV